MVNLVVTGYNGKSNDERPIEFVERKGKGHPDHLADGIGEEVSRRLTIDFWETERMGPYHFSDKVFIVGGMSVATFGGGKIIKPFKVNIVCVAREGLLQKDYLRDVIQNYLQNTLHEYKKDFSEIQPNVIQASEHTLETTDVNPLECDDTSLGVAFAPLSETEELVLKVEQTLNSQSFKSRYPVVGEDIKVMGYRNRGKIFLTIACALISKYIKNLNHHQEIKLALQSEVLKFCKSISEKEILIEINPDDRPEIGSVYLTVIGSSIEHGDCGLSGRGNRVMGINSVNRPTCIETVAGKDWLHPGKLYNIIGKNIAEELAKDLSAKEVYVRILGKVGEIVSNPEVVHVEINPKRSVNRSKIRRTVEYWFENLEKIRDQVLNKRIDFF